MATDPESPSPRIARETMRKLPKANLRTTVSYQGGKQRIAPQIADVICGAFPDSAYWDVCAGSGAFTLELVNRGISAGRLAIVEIGPWGKFWKAMGEGKFDLTEFRRRTDAIPQDRSRIQSYIEELAAAPVAEDYHYDFLILQAASFGGKAIWIEDGKWKHHGFKSFWQPTATSNRRSVCNPMTPLPDSLYDKMCKLVPKLGGIRVVHGDAEKVDYPSDAVLYIDPPYGGRTQYGHTIDWRSIVRRITNPCFVSEGEALNADAIEIVYAQNKGGISGNRADKHLEYLNPYNTLFQL